VKPENKVLATVTLTLYEGGEYDLKGIDPQGFRTQEEYIAATDALVEFFWRACADPLNVLPGGELFKAKRAAWTRVVGGLQAPVLVVGGIKLEGKWNG
jgi:hypothetical protein